MTFTKHIGTLVIAGLVPLGLALAQAAAPDSSQPESDKLAAMANGHMMGKETMDLDGQVRDVLSRLQENLSGLANESDVGAIHEQVIQDERLVEQLQETLDGRCGMPMGMMGSSTQSGQMMHRTDKDMPGAPTTSGDHMLNLPMSHRRGYGVTPQGPDQD
jgi:hypothetical protein